MSNKKQHLVAFLVAVGIVLFMGSAAVIAYQNRPKPQPTITVAKHEFEINALKHQYLQEEDMLVGQVEASKVQLTTLINQKAVACKDLAKYKIKSTGCQ